MRYAIDLIDAIALADGSRRLREVLADNRLPDDALLTTEAVLRIVLLDFVTRGDIDAIIQQLRERSK